MDRVRQLIADALARMGLSYADASRELDRNPAYISQYIAGKGPKQLDEKRRKKMAALIGVEEKLLIPDEPQPRNQGPIEPHAWDAAARMPLRGRTGVRDLPLWPASARGEIQYGSNDIPTAYVPRIEALLGNGAAFACRVIDGGLEPCLHVGDIAFFDPGDPVRPGDMMCLVQAMPNEIGTKRRLGVCDQISRSHLSITGGVTDGQPDQVKLEPHMQLGRMVGLLRR